MLQIYVSVHTSGRSDYRLPICFSCGMGSVLYEPCDTRALRFWPLFSSAETVGLIARSFDWCGAAAVIQGPHESDIMTLCLRGDCSGIAAIYSSENSQRQLLCISIQIVLAPINLRR